MSDHNLVAVILLNYNGLSDTLACLQSLAAVREPDFTVILCDNASAVDPRQAVETFCASKNWAMQNYQPGAAGARLYYIQNGANLGFAGGNNPGIRAAMAMGMEYIVLLNNDTLVEPDFLTGLITEARMHPEAGIVGGKIYYESDRAHIWAGGGGFVNSYTAVTTHFALNETDNPDNSRPRELGYVTGCLLLITRQAVEKAGLMDEVYFLYLEETDWNFAVRKAGFTVRYAPSAKIYHKVSATTGSESPLTKYLYVRNQIYFIRKHFRGHYRLVGLTLLLFKGLMRVVYQLLRGNGKRARVIWKGLIDGFAGRMGEARL